MGCDCTLGGLSSNSGLGVLIWKPGMEGALCPLPELFPGHAISAGWDSPVTL